MLYEKLPSPTSTRLIKLLPGTNEDPLACQLQTVDLESDDLDYPAISYAWGDPLDKKPIQCMNETLMIPTSLHLMLKTLRDVENEWVGWADAICINQSEDPEALRERAHQVEMMGTIFSKAKLVFVYLGEEPEGYEEFSCAAEALDRLGLENINAQMFDSLEFPEVLAKLGRDPRVWDTFNEILSRPWYQRVWTVQEFVLAQDIKMCIGDYAIDHVNFRSMCTMFEWFYLHLIGISTPGTQKRLSKSPSLQLGRCREARVFLDQCRATYEQDRTISLTKFVAAALRLQTTYARDRLYGGYGILDRTVMQNIPVDFGLSVVTLSQQLSARLLADGHLTFVLEHCACLNDSVSSWCINLDGAPLDLTESSVTLSRIHGVYTAAGNSTQPSLTVTAESRTMAAPGCILDTVRSLTDPSPKLNLSSGDTSPIEWLAAADWIETTLLWLGGVHSLPAGEHSWDKLPTQILWTAATNELWRTLISDLLPISEVPAILKNNDSSAQNQEWVAARPGPEFFENFRAWLQIFCLRQQILRWGREIKISSTEYRETAASCNQWMRQMSHITGKRVAVTYSRRLALLPREAEIGDEVCVFEGVNVPFVIRRSEEHYRLVGSCYLHGMMDGEALEREDWGLTQILIE